jgi:hypothetical protein
MPALSETGASRSHMKIIHLYTGDDGQSHFADLECAEGGDRYGIELGSGVRGVAFHDIPPGFSNDYHNAPRRQIVLQLTGQGEYICGDGTSRILGPGDILLADDLTGQGHRSREVSAPRRQALIYLDPDFDLSSLVSGK